MKRAVFANATERLEARRRQRREYYQRHKEAAKAYNKRHYHANRDALKLKANARAWRLHLKKAYGMTVADYDRMVREQGGQCFICGPNAKTYRKAKLLCVDHDHQTGRVRRLLCDRCNRLIATADEDPTILRAAALYVSEFKREVAA